MPNFRFNFIKFRVTFWKNVTRKLEKSNSNSDFTGLIIRFCRAQFQNPPNRVYFTLLPSVKIRIVLFTRIHMLKYIPIILFIIILVGVLSVVYCPEIKKIIIFRQSFAAYRKLITKFVAVSN